MNRYAYRDPPRHRRQTPARRAVALVDSGRERYIAMYGTDGEGDGWASDPQHPFGRVLTMRGFDPVSDVLGRPFAPYAGLDGLPLPFMRHRIWNGWANALIYFASQLPERDRNVIAYSHAGQAVWKAAAAGFWFRSATFIATPNRDDVPSDIGFKYLGFAQLIYDADADPIADAGAWFDRQRSKDRSFKHLGSRFLRYPVKGIGHGGVLHDPRLIEKWRTEPWLDNVRTSRTSEAA